MASGGYDPGRYSIADLSRQRGRDDGDDSAGPPAKVPRLMRQLVPVPEWPYRRDNYAVLVRERIRGDNIVDYNKQQIRTRDPVMHACLQLLDTDIRAPVRVLLKSVIYNYACTKEMGHRHANAVPSQHGMALLNNCMAVMKNIHNENMLTGLLAHDRSALRAELIQHLEESDYHGHSVYLSNAVIHHGSPYLCWASDQSQIQRYTLNLFH